MHIAAIPEFPLKIAIAVERPPASADGTPTTPTASREVSSDTEEFQSAAHSKHPIGGDPHTSHSSASAFNTQPYDLIGRNGVSLTTMSTALDLVHYTLLVSPSNAREVLRCNMHRQLLNVFYFATIGSGYDRRAFSVKPVEMAPDAQSAEILQTSCQALLLPCIRALAALACTDIGRGGLLAGEDAFVSTVVWLLYVACEGSHDTAVTKNILPRAHTPTTPTKASRIAFSSDLPPAIDAGVVEALLILVSRCCVLPALQQRFANLGLLWVLLPHLLNHDPTADAPPADLLDSTVPPYASPKHWLEGSALCLPLSNQHSPSKNTNWKHNDLNPRQCNQLAFLASRALQSLGGYLVCCAPPAHGSTTSTICQESPMIQAALSGLLTPQVAALLIHTQPISFLHIFSDNVDTPQLIWNTNMRIELATALTSQLILLEQRLQTAAPVIDDVNTDLHWATSFRYQCLREELVLAGVYVRPFVHGNHGSTSGGSPSREGKQTIVSAEFRGVSKCSALTREILLFLCAHAEHDMNCNASTKTDPRFEGSQWTSDHTAIFTYMQSYESQSDESPTNMQSRDKHQIWPAALRARHRSLALEALRVLVDGSTSSAGNPAPLGVIQEIM